MSLEVVLSKNKVHCLGSVGLGTVRSLRNEESKIVSTEGTSMGDSVQVAVVPVIDRMIDIYVV